MTIDSVVNPLTDQREAARRIGYRPADGEEDAALFGAAGLPALATGPTNV